MKKSKIFGLIVFLLILAGASVPALLYGSSVLLVNNLNLAVEPYFKLPFDLMHSGVKRYISFGKAAVAASFFLPVLIFGFLGWAVLMPKKRGLYGDAKMATKPEIIKSGLLSPDSDDDKFPSVIVGKVGDDFLLFKGQQFLYLAAPTRSGKGVGVVIPNCLHYRDSMVVLDVKGENHELTSGFRAACGQKVFKFAPDDEDGFTECWNPMTYVRNDQRLRVSDILGITNILYPPNPEEPWSATAENLFMGLALYIMDTPSEYDKGNLNIATIKRYSTTLPFLADEDTFKKYVEERKRFNMPLADKTVECLTAYAQTSDKMRTSIKISFDSPLAIFSDPVTELATSKSTFDFRNVRKQRMTVYVCIKPKSIDRFGLFLNLFFQQLILENLKELPQDNPTLKYQCLLMLDEFTAMGRVSIIEKASAYMAGYNMRLLLIFQSKSQVEDKKLYDVTGARTMLTNMALQIIYAPRDQNDAKDYSELMGIMTERGKSISQNMGGLGGGGGGGSVSTSDQRREVLLPQEIKDIGQDKAIVSMENMRPALVSKVIYYSEPVFIERYFNKMDNPHKNAPTTPPCQLVERNVIKRITTMEEVYGGVSEGLQPLPEGGSFEVGFSPERNAKEIVIGAILSAQKELLVAAYSMTCSDIAKAIGEQHAKGVVVRLVVDKTQNSQDQAGFKAIDYLSGLGVAIKQSVNYQAMHHKFIVIDGISVQLGSFNYTYSANKNNAETAIFLKNVPAIAAEYRREFAQLFREEDIGFEELKKQRAMMAEVHKLMEAA